MNQFGQQQQFQQINNYGQNGYNQYHAQGQLSYLQILKQQQVQELVQFYPESQKISENEDKVEYRLPMKLSISKTPLYVRVDLNKQFPQQPPIIQVLAKVVHKDIVPETKIFSHQMMKQWGLHSNLLQAIRLMQAEFEKQPPIPEKMAQKKQYNDKNYISFQQKKSIDQSDKDILNKVQNIEKAGELLNQMINKLNIDQIVNRLNNIEISELEEMQTNDQYLFDFVYEQPEIQQFNEQCDAVTDKAFILAKKNIECFDNISVAMQDHQKYMEVYTQKKEQLEEILKKNEHLKQKNSAQTLTKILDLKQNELLGECDKVRKQLKKNDISIEQFIDQFIKQKIQYHQIEVTKNKIRFQ